MGEIVEFARGRDGTARAGYSRRERSRRWWTPIIGASSDVHRPAGTAGRSILAAVPFVALGTMTEAVLGETSSGFYPWSTLPFWNLPLMVCSHTTLSQIGCSAPQYVVGIMPQ